MTSFYGYNCLSIPNKADFLSHIARLRPPALLFYQTELDFARQVKIQYPDMVVIIRNWPDAELHKDIPGRKRIEPIAWIAQHEAQAAGGLYLYTENESGLDADVVNWHLAVMDLAIERGIHLVLLNPATGTWDTLDYERLKPLLIKAAQHRDLFIIGLHSYAGGVITSGIAGGIPTHAGVDPNGADKDKGRNLIPRANWPSPVSDTTFHLGRHNWLMKYCYENLNMARDKMPRFALTETGFDFLGDIGSWLNTLDHSGFTSINGWHTVRAQWVQWWGGSAENWYVEQFKYARENLLSNLEFALFYCYGDDGNWGNYRVDNSAIPALLEAYAGVSTQPPPKPPETPVKIVFPLDFASRALDGFFTLSVARVNIRAYPTANSALLGKIDPNDNLATMYVPGAALRDNERVNETIDGINASWIPVEHGSIQGWIFSGYIVSIQPNIMQPSPVKRSGQIITDIQKLLDELATLL